MPIEAVTPEFSTKVFADPEQYRSTATDYERASYAVLRRGTFHAELSRVRIGGLLVQRARETLPRLVRTGLRPGRVAVVTWADDSPLPMIRGRQLERGDAMYLGPGTESHHRTSGPIEYIVVTLDFGQLKRAALETTGIEPKLPSTLVLRPPEHLRTLLPSVLEAALHAGSAWPHGSSSALSVASLEQAILQALVLSVEHSEGLKERSQRSHRAALAKRFEAVVEANLERDLDIRGLCTMIGASGRMLRSLCQEQLGMSPQRFVAMRRLQRIRQALVGNDRGSATVTEIAMQFGIWELGRFAGAYRALFGEAPSTTLRRSVGRKDGVGAEPHI